MGRTISIAKKITVSAGDSGTTTLYEVENANKFTLKRVIFHFPPGTNGNVGLAIRKGIKDVCPDQGLVYGEDVKIDLGAEVEFVSGEEVLVYYINADASNSYDIIVAVEGVIE